MSELRIKELKNDILLLRNLKSSLRMNSFNFLLNNTCDFDKIKQVMSEINKKIEVRQSELKILNNVSTSLSDIENKLGKF